MSGPAAGSTAIGEVVDEVRFSVEAGKVREFVAATATTDPVHLDEDVAAARGLDALPSTATHVMVCGHHRDQAAMIRTLGLTLERVMVGSVRWRYHRPCWSAMRCTGFAGWWVTRPSPGCARRPR